MIAVCISLDQPNSPIAINEWLTDNPTVVIKFVIIEGNNCFVLYE